MQAMLVFKIVHDTQVVQKAAQNELNHHGE